jgi:PHD/YefM family antitoxin component YafN of YafNO toxin-antitoxin module
MGNITRITGNNGENFVQLPEKDYLALIEQLEDFADIKAYDEAKRTLASGEDYFVPFKFGK